MQHELENIDFQKSGLIGGDYNPDGKLFNDGSKIRMPALLDTVEEEMPQSFDEYYNEYHSKDRAIKHGK